MSSAMFLSGHELAVFFNKILDVGFLLDFTEEGQLSVSKENVLIAHIRLPIIFPAPEREVLRDYLIKMKEYSHEFSVILIQTGAAALGYVENGELINHKVIKKYMVRKSQGKSQLTYLKTKGKSRLGSRLRLKNAIEFFVEINEKLNNWKVGERSDLILLSCPVNLKNMFFNSKIQTPFDKRDKRIRKIPLDVKVPCFDELKRIVKYAISAKVTVFNNECIELGD